MRSLFTEHDLVSAEIQNIGADGVISLHTRSLKYGKLENGQLIVVPSSLVKRLPQHYISFPWGVDVILGRNGFVWITRCVPLLLVDTATSLDAAHVLVLFAPGLPQTSGRTKRRTKTS